MQGLRVFKNIYVLLLQASWASMQGSPVQPWQGAVCGAFAGGIAAATTTPLDVAKTRVMLAKVGSIWNAAATLLNFSM